jgi:hypothetical protein
MATYNSLSQSPQTRERIANARSRQRAKKDASLQLWRENRAKRARRSPQQQLTELDDRIGKGIGAARERKRLQEQIKGLK